MDQFEYVMVLVSIIIGLGVAHVLLGLGRIVDRLAGHTRSLRLSAAYFSWLGVVFVWTLLFWWWEYRFADFVTDWTVGLYFFLVTYAMVLFLMAAVLVPRSWDQVDDLADYFLERRVWFYSLMLFANGLDVLDSFLKGIGISGLFGFWRSADAGLVAWAGVGDRSHGISAVPTGGLQEVCGMPLPTI